MRYLLAALAVAVVLVALPAVAQPVATSDQSFAWDYPDADIAASNVVRFELRLDANAFADVGMVPYTTGGATEQYMTPIPATTTGQHTVEVRACNVDICGAATSFAFRLGVVPATVPSITLVDTPE